MTQILSIRLDAETKKRLDKLAQRSRRSKSFLAAEAIAAYIEVEEWQIGEIQAGIEDLNTGNSLSHESVSKWLSSWGRDSESKPPHDYCMVSPGHTPIGESKIKPAPPVISMFVDIAS